MKKLICLLGLGFASIVSSIAQPEPQDLQLLPDGCTFSPISDNPYFPLYPGLRLVLRGEEDGEISEVIWEVLNQTRTFTLDFEVGSDGVTFETAIVRETESVDGELVEISHNYFAQCVETGTVFYFGEDVDDYENGAVAGHSGAWLAGVDGNAPGVIMPGVFVVGDSYFQEFAPGTAEDIGFNLGADLMATTAAGQFESVIEIEEADPLELDSDPSVKQYAPGIGLIFDDGIELVEFNLTPSLGVEKAIRLSWPLTGGDYVLESAETVDGQWSTINTPVTDLDGRKVAWVVLENSMRLFRLRSL